jgi:hypothetical protein
VRPRERTPGQAAALPPARLPELLDALADALELTYGAVEPRWHM